MEQSAKDAWKRLLDEARRELPEATVRTWLEPAVPLGLEDGRRLDRAMQAALRLALRFRVT